MSEFQHLRRKAKTSMEDVSAQNSDPNQSRINTPSRTVIFLCLMTVMIKFYYGTVPWCDLWPKKRQCWMILFSYRDIVCGLYRLVPDRDEAGLSAFVTSYVRIWDVAHLWMMGHCPPPCSNLTQTPVVDCCFSELKYLWLFVLCALKGFCVRVSTVTEHELFSFFV